MDLVTEQTLSPADLDKIDPDAIKVVRRLLRYGFEAYLVGGCVRDLLLQRQPKDFDVATSATPPEIKRLFRNSRIIGRRFRLAHIFFGSKIIETSTFRAPPDPNAADGDELLIRRDNVFGTAREDALRRDFTINGLFLDLKERRILDYVGGLEDVNARRIRTIGDPRIRMQEDPVRIIRAVKFATRLGFVLDPATEAAMIEFRGLIAKCSVARVLEEIYRLLASGHATAAFRLLHRTGVLAVLFPEIHGLLGPSDHPLAQGLVLPISDAAEEPAHPRAPEARDPEPEELLATQQPALQPSAEDLARSQAEWEDLVLHCIGDDPGERQQAAAVVWSHLEALDRLIVATPLQPPSHALLLAFTIMGLARRQLAPERPMAEAIPVIEHLVHALSVRLRISRKDRERLKQLFVAQRRMLHRGRRSRPAALTQRDYFAEAWQLFECSCQATGEHLDDLKRWQQLLHPSGKARRRRRRRRTHRQPAVLAQP